MSSDADTPAPVAVPPQPKVKLVQIAPAARAARLRSRHKITIASFGLFVLLPVFVIAVYLYGFANDQYASKVGFTVRTEETGSAMQFLGGLSSFSSASSTDTDVLYKFIQSQELVREIDATLGLRDIYRKTTNDPYYALAENSSIEDLVKYWTRMVRIYYDRSTGLMEIEARAFEPADAQAIAREIFLRSTKMINTLSSVAREDTTRYAREELDTAISRLREARQALTKFRNETQIVDPSADLQGQMGLLNSLNSQLAASLIDLDLLADTTRETDPRMEQARRKIAVIEKRIAEEREKLGVGSSENGSAYADLVGQFSVLQSDLEFAQKAYVSALSAYDTAVAEARRQSRYLAAYIEPTMPETALYPQRITILVVSAFLFFGVWAIAVLIFYSLRDRR